jgi:hypothetical protein
MNLTSYFAREVRALGEFNLPCSFPSFLVRNAGYDYRICAKIKKASFPLRSK